MNLDNQMISILSHGIRMETNSQEEEEEFLLNLTAFINKSLAYRALYGAIQNGLLVETVCFDPICYIQILNETLVFLPLSENDFFPVIMKALEYISNIEKEKAELLKEFNKDNDDNLFEWV